MSAEEVGFDIETGLLRIGQTSIFLTPREAQIYGLLAKHIGQIVTYERFYSLIWPGGGMFKQDPKRTLRVYVTRLRRRFESEKSPWRIEVHYGYGYRMVSK